MKKIFCLCFIFLFSISFVNGHQQMPEKAKRHANPDRERPAGIPRVHFQGNSNLQSQLNELILLKSKSITWNWDSVTTYDTLGVAQKLSRTFDVNGHLLTQLAKKWENNSWSNYYRITYTYDVNGNVLTGLEELWQTNAWVNASRLTLTWDASGDMLTYLEESWSAGIWVNSYIINFTYDSNGNMLTQTSMHWTDSWQNSYRYTWTYDSNGNMLTELDENGQGNTWVNSHRNTYTNDANGNRLTEVVEQWQSDSWANQYRETYTYDTNGNMLTELYEEWQSNSWVNSERFTYTYDASGNMLTELDESWYYNNWNNNIKQNYTYDTNGNLLTLLMQFWMSGIWSDVNRSVYTYDSNGNSVTGKNEIKQGDSWIPDMGFMFIYSQKKYIDYISDSYRYEASFKSFLNGVEIKNSNPGIFSVAPNPATDKIIIQAPVLTSPCYLSILDLNGRELLQQVLDQPSTRVDISMFAKGVYLIKLTVDGKVQVIKLVKR